MSSFKFRVRGGLKSLPGLGILFLFNGFKHHPAQFFASVVCVYLRSRLWILIPSSSPELGGVSGP